MYDNFRLRVHGLTEINLHSFGT